MKEDSEKKKMKMKKTKEEYEYCKICRINHNHGRRHNYFPRHTSSLSSLLSRFLHKLSLLNSPLSNPTFSLPLHASSSSSPFWCTFCEFDVHDVGASFASGNVIKHLASEDHLKNVKQFLWKYGGGGGGGGGSSKVDSFRVTEANFAQWEKKCEDLTRKAAASSGIHQGSFCRESNDIQHNYRNLNNFDENNIHFHESNLSNNVLPLQYDTNKNYQVCLSDISAAGNVGPFYQSLGVQTRPQGSDHGINTCSSTYIGGGTVNHLPQNGANLLANCPAHGGIQKNLPTTNKEPFLNGYQTLTKITSANSEDDKGNVHSGAPPPWLEGTETASEVGQPTTARSIQKNCRKTSKLNPKRVGAAWAEKRKRELEMEKTGEIVANTSAPDWLPNFGSVWQSGTRKESLKEFKKRKVDVSNSKADYSQSDAEIKLQPYVSKRMVNPKADSQPETEIKLQPYVSKRMVNPKADSQPDAEIKLQPYVSKRMRLETKTFSSEDVEETGDMS